MLIRSGDTVEIRSGNERGTRAKVLAVRPSRGPAHGLRLVVEGVNRVYRHIRRSQKNPQGGRLSKEMPIDASNAAFVCSACGKAVRLGAKLLADGGKVRVCRACGAEHGALKRARAVTNRTATKSSN
jgi:large subunit ribosomal protein L24